MTKVALNYVKIEPHQETVWNIKLFINKYNWDGTKYT